MRDHRLPDTVLTIAITVGLAAGCAPGNTNSTGSAVRTPAGPNAGGQVPSSPASSPPSARRSAAPVRSSGSGVAAGTARCHTTQLAGRVRMLDAAAGNRYAALVLINTSDRTCHTYGFVGLQLTGAGGKDLPTKVVRETRPAPLRVTLQPGKSAWTRIHWTVASGTGEPVTGQCEPTPSRLLVIPPEERTQLATDWPGGSVCKHGEILVTALSPGTG